MLDTVTLLPSTIETGWEQRFEDPVLREGKERKGHKKRK